MENKLTIVILTRTNNYFEAFFNLVTWQFRNKKTL